MAEQQYLLEMHGISKSFGGVHALKNVSLRLRPGSVHALMGENGAGKSTLMRILLGAHQPDKGEIFFQGKEITLRTPGDGLAMGFAMVNQELLQMEEMSVADNLYMGRFPGSLVVNRKEQNRMARKLFEDLGIAGIQPTVRIRQLSMAQKQLVEIAKAVSYNAKVIVMDEPTSSLMDKEIEILFQIIRDLRDRGCAIVYISHKMEEIFQIADDITVLRDGELIGSKPASELNDEMLIQMMVGRKLQDLYVKSPSRPGGIALEVEGLSAEGRFENVSFQVRHSEVVGFAGLMGAGRSEIMETIFGIRPKKSGTVKKDGQIIEIKRPKDAIRHKIAFVTEDRKRTGLFLNMSIQFNASISSLDLLNAHRTVSRKREARAVEEISDRLKLKRSSIRIRASALSGGNQQKVVLAKWMLTEPDILILDEPTRGIDIGAKKEIYTMIDDLAKEGKAILVISSEMPEVIGISDRVLVMHEGRLRGEVGREDVTQEKLMSYMT